MAVIKSNPGIDSPLLSVGVPLHLGSLSAANDVLKFTLPTPTGFSGHGLIILATANGTVTTLTSELDISLDNGTTFIKLADGPAAVPNITQLDVKGAGGVPAQVKASAVTLGTATKIDFYLLAG